MLILLKKAKQLPVRIWDKVPILISIQIKKFFFYGLNFF